jgi:hypothetical protein
MLWTRERTPTFYPSIVLTFRFTIEFINEFGGASKGQSMTQDDFIQLQDIAYLDQKH